MYNDVTPANMDRTNSNKVHEVLSKLSNLPLYSTTDILRECLRVCNGNGLDIADTIRYETAVYIADCEDAEYKRKLIEVHNRLS